MSSSILVVSGSLRSGSFNTHLARQAVARAPQGVTARLSDAPRTLPHYDGDLDTDSPPSEVAAWRQSITESSAILFVTPTYNHALPGVLKNALDSAYPEWNRKPAAYIGYGGVGAARAVGQLRLINIGLQMAAIRTAVHIQGADFTEVSQQGKQLSDLPHLERSANAMLNELIWWANALKRAREQA